MTWTVYHRPPVRGRDVNAGSHQGRLQYTRRRRGRHVDEEHAAKGQPQDGALAGDLQRTGKVMTWADGPDLTLYFDKTKAGGC